MTSLYFVFIPFLRLLFHSQEPGKFVLLFTGISGFIFICCYCNRRRAFVPKRVRFNRCLHNNRTVFHHFNFQSLYCKTTSVPCTTLVVGLYFPSFVLTFRWFFSLQLQFEFHNLPPRSELLVRQLMLSVPFNFLRFAPTFHTCMQNPLVVVVIRGFTVVFYRFQPYTLSFTRIACITRRVIFYFSCVIMRHIQFIVIFTTIFRFVISNRFQSFTSSYFQEAFLCNLPVVLLLVCIYNKLRR